MNKIFVYLCFFSAILNAFPKVCYSDEESQYVVFGHPEIMIQIEGKGDFEFMIVMVKDKRFNSPVPMINKGIITGIMIGDQIIELIDGVIVDGFVSTRDYGKVRILGVSNPVYLWITSEQKDQLMLLK